VSTGDPRSSEPHSRVRPGSVIGTGLPAFVGFTVSPGLGVALAALALVVWVGTVTWAVRFHRRRTRSLREAGEKQDLRYLERRLTIYFWLILVCFASATVGVALLLASPGHHGPAWPLILPLILMGAALVTIWVYARVVLRGTAQGRLVADARTPVSSGWHASSPAKAPGSARAGR
jgi:drug/metabolite transporter (DMT)-like permease